MNFSPIIFHPAIEIVATQTKNFSPSDWNRGYTNEVRLRRL